MQGRDGSASTARLGGLRGGGLVLGVAMALGNVLGYVSIVLVSAALGPADFGAVAALTSLGVVTAIPAGAVQVLIARRSSRDEDSAGAYALTGLVGLSLWAALLVVSVPLASSFALDSVWPVFWLGLTLVPMTMAGVQQGVLLGTHRLGRLSTLFVVGGLARLAATIWCVRAEPSVAGAFAAWAVATLVGFGAGHVLSRDVLPGRAAVRGLSHLVRALGRSSVSLFALILLTSLDTILARHVLSERDSGIYGIASMFAKIIFWGTQFIAMVVVPRLAQRHASHLVLKAYGAVVAIGVPIILVIAIDPSFWVSARGLDEYADAGGLLIGFAALGLLWALTQVSVFVDMGLGRGTMTVVVLTGAAIELVLVALFWHSTSREVWLATFVAALFVAVAPLALMAVRHRAATRPQAAAVRP